MRAAPRLLAVVAVTLAALPAAADWLVLEDGTRVETRGAWREKGRLVVFTSADGRLSSLRADGVDLTASRRATEEAKAAAARPAAAAPAAPAAPPKAVRTITNADIPSGRPAPTAAAAGAATGEATGETEAGQPPRPAPTATDLSVRDTTQSSDAFDGHLVITGVLGNGSAETAAAIELTVQAYGPEGELLASTPATLETAALGPGAATRFEAHFAEVFGGAFALRFAPAATFLETASQEGAEAAAPAEQEPFPGPA